MTDRKQLWIGGTLGLVLTVVSASLEVALKSTVWPHRVPGTITERGYTETWTATFLDGEGALQFRTTLDGCDLYVQCFDLEDASSLDSLDP